MHNTSLKICFRNHCDESFHSVVPEFQCGKNVSLRNIEILYFWMTFYNVEMVNVNKNNIFVLSLFVTPGNLYRASYYRCWFKKQLLQTTHVIAYERNCYTHYKCGENLNQNGYMGFKSNVPQFLIMIIQCKNATKFCRSYRWFLPDGVMVRYNIICSPVCPIHPLGWKLTISWWNCWSLRRQWIATI